MFRGQRLTYARGSRLERHAHADAQFLYAVAGVMEVRTDLGAWIVPPQRAVWIPPGCPHAVAMRSAVDMRTLWLDAPGSGRPLPGPSVPGPSVPGPSVPGPSVPGPSVPGPSVLAVDPLLREIAVELVRLGALPAHEAEPARRLLAVFFDRLQAAPDLPLHLPMPRDPRARRVAEAVRRDPADPRTLAERAAAAGASRRTLIRLFRQETGMGFEDWQRQARLLAGLACLGEGGSVTEAAGASGYATPSAFAAMFRRCLGVAPSRFFATPDRDTEG